MSTDVTTLVAGVISREVPAGGSPYTNDPNDPGGETCWGISVEVARAYGYTGYMQAMTRATAMEIYTKRYWLLPQLDKLDVIVPTVAAKLFDVGVNMGQATAVRFLQRALNDLRQEGKDILFRAVSVDGVLGPLSLQATRIYLAARAELGLQVLLFMIRGQQAVRYMELAEQNVSQLTYEFGWENARAML